MAVLSRKRLDVAVMNEWTPDALNALFYNDLDLCGCGNPEDAYNLVRDTLALAPLYENEGWKRAEDLIGSPGATHLVLSMLTTAHLIEHGSGMGGSWLTPKGEQVLHAMRQFTWDDVDPD